MEGDLDGLVIFFDCDILECRGEVWLEGIFEVQIFASEVQMLSGQIDPVLTVDDFEERECFGGQVVLWVLDQLDKGEETLLGGEVAHGARGEFN